jgi:hypothetical protein
LELGLDTSHEILRRLALRGSVWAGIFGGHGHLGHSHFLTSFLGGFRGGFGGDQPPSDFSEERAFGWKNSMKTITLDLKISLPTGQTIDLAKHSLTLSGLEAYALDMILAACGGNLDVKAEASVTEAA